MKNLFIVISIVVGIMWSFGGMLEFFTSLYTSSKLQSIKKWYKRLLYTSLFGPIVFLVAGIFTPTILYISNTKFMIFIDKKLSEICDSISEWLEK